MIITTTRYYLASKLERSLDNSAPHSAAQIEESIARVQIDPVCQRSEPLHCDLAVGWGAAGTRLGI